MVASGRVIRRAGKTGGSQPIMLLLTVCAIISVVMREQKRERRLLPVKTSAKSLTYGGERGIRNVGIFLSQKKSTRGWVTNSAEGQHALPFPKPVLPKSDRSMRKFAHPILTNVNRLSC